jgi:hypothetical protein
MAPGLGEKYQLEVEIIAKTRETYQSEEYQRSGLPAASAIMIGAGVIARGGDLGQEQLEEAIRRHLTSQQPRR